MSGYNYYIDYEPRLVGNLVICEIYFVLLVVNVVLGFMARDKFYPISFVIGCLLEHIGFIGRYMGHNNPHTLALFMMQSIGTIIAPIFFMAGIYNTFGQMVPIFGEKYSVFKPKTYRRIFIVSDVISLLCQCGGGGVTSTLASSGRSSQMGTWIMLGALIFQVVSMTIYLLLTGLFFLRVHRGHKRGEFSPKKYEYMRNSSFFMSYVYGMFISTIFIYIRCVYRVAEMSHGYDGPLTRNEVWFLIFDASMVIVGVSVITCTYPGAALGKGSFKNIVYPNRNRNVEEIPLDSGLSKQQHAFGEYRFA